MAEVGLQAENDSGDGRVPFEENIGGQPGFRLGRQAVPLIQRQAGIDRNRPAHPGDDVVQGDALGFAGRLEPGQGLGDPVESLFQVLQGRGVGNPDMIVGSERVAGNDRHLGFPQEIIRHPVGVADGRPVEFQIVKRPDVRKKIKSALRLETGDAGDGSELHQGVVAPAFELGPHPGDVGLGSG